MPKIPDANDLGPRPIPRPTRGIPNFEQAGAGVQRGADIQSRDAREAGTGLKALGEGLGAMEQAFDRAQQRIMARQDAVELARAVSSYNEESANELREMQTSGDFSRIETGQKYAQGRRESLQKHIDGYQGSEDGRARLHARLEGIRSQYIGQSVAFGAEASKKRVMQTLGENLNGMLEGVYSTPSSLQQTYKSLDGVIDDVASALTPEDEIEFRENGRQILAMRAIDSYLDRRDIVGAKEILATTPGLNKILSPAQQTNLTQRIVTIERATEEAANKGRMKLLEAEQILGRKPNLQERVLLAGVAPKEGRETPTEKIAGIEAALGRPLDKAERSRALGLGGGEAQSTPGKILSDRQRLIDMYGKGSEQVQAFDDLASKPAEPPSLADIGGQRKEFTRLSGDFVQVRDSFNRIVTSATKASPAGDLSLMFNYMKMLDPGSVVRESEFATVAATGSFGQRLQAAAEQFLAGNRLTDEQRKDFAERAELLMTAQTRSQLMLEQQFRDIAQRAGINGEDVVVDFVGPLRAKFPNAPPARTGGTKTGDTVNPPVGGPRLKFDLQGNVVGK